VPRNVSCLDLLNTETKMALVQYKSERKDQSLPFALDRLTFTAVALT
jgi:hypothetical protein